MSFTLAHIWSGVRSRLRDPAAATPAAITLEANNALDELRGRVRQSREDWLDVVETTDVIADKDVYDYPDAADTLKMIERIDLAADDVTYPSYPIGYHQSFERGIVASTKLLVSDTIIVLPGRRIRLQPMPTASFAGGIRWTYLPRMTPFADAADVPIGVPPQFCEWLIVGTLDRMKQFRGVELADPAAYERFRVEQTMRLERELRPKELLAPPRIIDEDEFYSFV